MKGSIMFDKKQEVIKSPDLRKMQEVVIDLRTRIYIAVDDDPKKARERYLAQFPSLKKF
jgi:hypothetical protein